MKTLLPKAFLLAPIFVFMIFFLCAADATQPSGKITLRDGSNRVMGYIGGGSGKVAVHDNHNRFLGYVDSDTTWSKTNRVIARSRLPGLLFCDKHNR